MDYSDNYLQELVATEQPQVENDAEVENVVSETPTNEEVTSEEANIENLETEITPEAPATEVKEIVEPTKPVNEKIAELNEFLNKNPKLSEADYFELKKPLADIPEEELIRKYLTEKEGLTPSELKLKMKELQNGSTDDEFGDDFFDEDSEEYLTAQAKKERLLKDAQAYHTEKIDGLFNSADGENGKTTETQVPTEEQVRLYQQELKQNYDASIMQSANELEGVDIEVNGEKIKVIPTDNERKSLMETGYKLNEITNRYFSADGLNLDKPTEFAKDITFWITPETRNAAIKSAYEQGLEAGKLSQMKSQRNINGTVKVEVEASDAAKENLLNKLYASSRVAR